MPYKNNKQPSRKRPIRQRVLMPSPVDAPVTSTGPTELMQPVLLAELPEPRFATLLLWSVSLLLVAIIGWAAVSPLDEVARASGSLTAHGDNIPVQHLDGGLVRRLFVREGQQVKLGDVLLELEDGTTRQDLVTVRSRIDYLDNQLILLNTVLTSGTSVSTTDTLMPELAAQLARRQTLASGLATATDEWHRQQRLQAQGLGTTGRVYAALRDQQAMAQQLTALDADMQDQRQRLMSERMQQQEQLTKLSDRQSRLIVYAPASGTIQNMRVNTPGAVVPAGGVMMEIVPNEAPLVARLHINPADIAVIKPGQAVQLKVSAYDYSRYGNLRGQLVQLSPDTQAVGGVPMYQGWVKLPVKRGNRASFSNGRMAQRLLPGMTVQADIITGRRTILQYLLRPLEASLDTAWKER